MSIFEIHWSPSPRELRQFVGLWFPAFFALVGGLVGCHTRSWTAAAWVWLPAAAVSLVAIMVPRFARWLYIGWTAAALPIGWVVGHVILATIYYVLVTPIALMMRLVGRDPLSRRFDREATTYWIARSSRVDPQRYFRQF
jgi:uncharacterized membrane protein